MASHWIRRFAMLTLGGGLLLPASTPTLSPECDAANQEASQLLNAERIGEAESLTSSHISQLAGTTRVDRICKAILLTNLAIAQERLGKLDQAARSAQDSIALIEGVLGRDDPRMRAPLLVLASISVGRGQYERVTRLLSRVESLENPAPRELAVTYGLRSIVYAHQRRLPEAEDFGRRAIDEWGKAGLGDSLNVIPDLSNLATVLLCQKRPAEAVRLLERSLRILASSPDNVSIRGNILLIAAIAYWNQADIERAGEYFQQAITLQPNLSS